MPTTIKVWEVVNESLQPVKDDSFANNHLEKQLEAWVAEDPSILGERLLIIARQKDIQGVGRLDLLGVDKDGTIVIVELKRDYTPREAVAQALDYASWLHSADEMQIVAWAKDYLKQPFKEKFCEYFEVDVFPDLSCQKHLIVLIAPKLDVSAERIIMYLSEQYGVRINAVFFQYARLSDGKEILARAVLVADPAPKSELSNERATGDGLMKTAADQGTARLVDICRAASGFWFEEAVSTFGGSFRYWATSAAGQDRMVFGVNVAAKAEPPHGQLDVWIPARSLAEVAGRQENDVRSALEKQPISGIQMGRGNPSWIRLKTVEEAQVLVQQLREFVSPPLKAGAHQ